MSSSSVAGVVRRPLLRLGKVLLLVSAMSAVACGQKGPLSLPTAASPASAAAASSATNAVSGPSR